MGIFAAETVSQQTMAFVVRHTSGVICTAMYGEDLDRLKLGPMVSKNEDPKGTAFAVTVDLKDGVTTGISAGAIARRDTRRDAVFQIDGHRKGRALGVLVLRDHGAEF